MGTPNVGKCVQFGAGASSADHQFEVLWPFDFGKRGTLVESNGLRGTRERFSTNVNLGTYTVGGRVPMDVRPDTIDFWAYRILGGEEAADVFEPAEALPTFVVAADRGADVCTAAGCKVATAEFSGQSGEDLRLEMDIEGLTETIGAAGSFPAISATLSVEQPFIFHQGVLTLGGSAYPFRRFRLTINNALVLDRFMNTQSRSALPEGDRIVTLQTDNPWTTTEKAALYDVAIAGLSATLVFTNGTNVLTFTFGNLKVAVQPPTVQGRELEIMLPLAFNAYSKNDEPSIKITNVWTASSGV